MSLPQTCQDGKPVHSVEVEIEQNEIGRISQRGLQSFGTVVASDHFVIAPLQLADDLPGKPRVIFDHQNPHGRFSRLLGYGGSNGQFEPILNHAARWFAIAAAWG